tara:strand:+ start:952 stop:1575 length:624 start_codon:yes stop_codon:yes gene_type:complete
MIIFRYEGIPVRLHFSFWILVAFLVLPEMVTGSMGSAFLLVLMLTGLFGSVVLHEFGHALMARRFGIDTTSITLYPFGGIAALKSEPQTSRSEFYIAVAGPAVNIVLCVMLFPFYMIDMPLAAELITVNLVLGIFNLIPAFPMDGGRILRAYLSQKMSRKGATIISLRVSRVFAWVFIALGLVTSGVNLVLIGGFLLLFISQIERQV